MQRLVQSLRLLIITTCLTTTSFRVSAEVTNADESDKRLKLSQTVQPLGPNPFGESINLYTGDVSFSQLDASIEGNGPSISFIRAFETLDPLGETTPQQNAGFGDWRLAIPHIETLTPGNTGVTGFVGEWKVQVGNSNGGSYNRCTNFDVMWTPPVGYTSTPHFGGMDTGEWWRGYQLVIPGESTRDILYRNASNNIKPNSGVFPGVTTDHWQIGCGVNVTNGQPGEGFIVLSPSGTKYFLTQLVYSDYESFLDQNQGDEGPHPYFQRLTRKVARMYASRVEDRFGNSITYTYSSDRLTGVSGSDGRSVLIEWWTDAPVIKKITVQPTSTAPRAWQYEYADRTSANPRLTKVVLPDGSYWEYGFAGIRSALLQVKITGCLHLSPTSSSTDHAYMTPTSGATVRTPSGLTGDFAFSIRLNGQSYLPTFCVAPSGSEAAESGNPFFASRALTQKTITGPGMASQVWKYGYENAHANAERFCATPTSCPSTSYTDVTNPENMTTRYVHSTKWDINEGRLARTEYGLSGTTSLRTESFDYYTPNGDRPQLSPIGGSMQVGSTNIFKIENNVPVLRTSVKQNGRMFSETVNSFDAYSRAMSVTKESVDFP